MAISGQLIIAMLTGIYVTHEHLKSPLNIPLYHLWRVLCIWSNSNS